MQKLFDGTFLKEALLGAEKCVESHIDELNLLNVFPVPDGDTGINMFLTLQAANKAWCDTSTDSAAAVSAAAARGALLGACGNSGVILSQILRGMAKGLEMKPRFSSINFADALQAGADMARRAVVNPVEGTIITVIREASDIAARMAAKGSSLRQMMTAVVNQAKKTVNKTPNLLPQLKEAGVVDAGAKGLFYFFQGMKNHMWARLEGSSTAIAGDFNVTLQPEVTSYGYDLQFLIQGKNMPLLEIRNRIESMGDSVIVVGDEEIIRVHIHTLAPDDVVRYARLIGNITNLVKENLDKQVIDFKSRHNIA